MIREFKNEDTSKLIEIINKGYIIEDKDIISNMQAEDKKLFIYDDSVIKGFAYIGFNK